MISIEAVAMWTAMENTCRFAREAFPESPVIQDSSIEPKRRRLDQVRRVLELSIVGLANGIAPNSTTIPASSNVDRCEFVPC